MMMNILQSIHYRIQSLDDPWFAFSETAVSVNNSRFLCGVSKVYLIQSNQKLSQTSRDP